MSRKGMAWQGKAWHVKAREDMSRQGMACQGKARQDMSRKGMACQGKAWQGNARHKPCTILSYFSFSLQVLLLVWMYKD